MPDMELSAWQRQWRAASEDGEAVPSAAHLRGDVERESRRMRIGLIAPVGVTVGIGGGVLARALYSAQSADAALAIGVWASILIAWAGAIWISRGTWRPLAETTAAFVDLAVRRCRSGLRAAGFAAMLYLGQLLFIVLWKLTNSTMSASAVLTEWPVVVLGWIGFPVFLAGTLWYRRKKRAELDELLELQRQLVDRNG